jgi:hypothetical protein
MINPLKLYLPSDISINNPTFCVYGFGTRRQAVVFVFQVGYEVYNHSPLKLSSYEMLQKCESGDWIELARDRVQ